MKQHRLEHLANLYKKAKAELKNRDFGKVSTEKLVDIVTKMEDRLRSELETISFSTKEVEDDIDWLDHGPCKKVVVTPYSID